LIKHGANVNYLDYHLKHPLEFAEMNPQKHTRDNLENNVKNPAPIGVITGILIGEGGLLGYINIREHINKPGVLPASVEGGHLHECRCLWCNRSSNCCEGNKQYDADIRKDEMRKRLGKLDNDEFHKGLLLC